VLPVLGDLAKASSGSVAALVTGSVVELVSAFASTTGTTIGGVAPIVVPLAADPSLPAARRRDGQRHRRLVTPAASLLNRQRSG